MGNLSNILGGPWKLANDLDRIDAPEDQLKTAMINAGIEPPEDIHLDGKLHRFNNGTKKKTGWYVGFRDSIPAGRFGCWRSDIEMPWRGDVGRDLSAAEQMSCTKRMAEAKAARDVEMAKKQDLAATTVETIWQNAGLATADHPYLITKQIKPNGARVTGDGRLIVPIYNADHNLISLQYIGADSSKQFQAGGKVSGGGWSLGVHEERRPIYIVEGFATGATVHELTDCMVVISYSASNTTSIAKQIRADYPDAPLVVIADNDEHGVGLKNARQAQAETGCRVVMPDIIGMDANDYHNAGHDLIALLQPPQEETAWLIPADEMASQPAPIAWIVKHWLQGDALIMVHGPSGGGKSFIVLDWAMAIAGSLPSWMGHKVRNGSVVYLAGEGHHGLRSRIAAWKQHNQVDNLNMYVSRAGCDLNTPEGLERVLTNIGALPEQPKLIIVDTLHRFLNGDENSSVDTKSMLDACAVVGREFNCSVLLVHHTGVSDESQHRARGSSAWRGALDIEISVKPGTDSSPIEIIQRKSKDAEMAEPIYGELQSVQINGWYDEDGEPVTSAVFSETDKQPSSTNKKPSKLDKFCKMFERAWWESGAEDIGGKPYITRSALKEKLKADGNADRTILNMVNPSYSEKLIGALINAGIIKPFDSGWILLDEVQISAMMMRRNS